MDYTAKIKTLEEIKVIADKLKKQNKKIVTTNGSFDLLHPGHIHSLNFAKSLGDILIVGLNSDASIKKYKSPSRPIIDEQGRAIMLANLACVDYVVVIDKPEIAVPLVRSVRPDVHVKGEEYKENLIEKNDVKKAGGKIVYAPLLPGFSTTKIIRKILSQDSTFSINS